MMRNISIRKIWFVVFIQTVLFFVFNGISYGQSIWKNPITGNGINPNTTNPYTTGQTVDPWLTVSGIGKGTGVNGVSSKSRYNAQGWSTTTLDANDYFYFTLTPSTWYKIKFASFVFNCQRSDGGPRTFALRSSLDGYATDIQVTTLNVSKKAILVTNSLSALNFQNITSPITFRVYGYAATNTSGTLSINDFTFNGTVSTVTISGFNPAFACSGSGASVIITGTNFTGATAVKFNGTSALSYTVNSDTQITATLPAGATTGAITVTTPLATATSSGSFTVNALPTAPTVGTRTQPTCALSTGSVILNGLPSSGSWTLTRSPGGVTNIGSGTSATISGLASGTYTYTVTNSNVCTSVASLNVVINAQPPTPTDPTIGTITQPSCSLATGSVVLSDLPAGNWTLTRSPGGVTTSGSGASTTISGLATGTYFYTVKNSDGCTSIASDNVVINAQPATPTTPTVGTITQPTCSTTTGSVVLSGLPTGNWIINPGNITGSATSTTIAGLTQGTYNFTVTSSNGCTSAATSNVAINAPLPVPATPAQTVDCTAGFNHAIVTVTSPIGTGLEYRLDGGTYQTGTSFSNVINGNHTITVRNSSGCTKVGSQFQVNCGCVNQPTIFLSSETGSTCGTSAQTVSGNTFTNATTVSISTNGTGTLNSTSVTTSPFTFTYTPTASDAGNIIIITLTSNNPQGSPCEADIVTYELTVNTIPSAPTLGAITQPTCAIQSGSISLNGLPSSGNWTIIQSPGAIATTGSGGSKTISGLAPGNYTFTVTDDKGCTSPSSGNVVINSLPTAPAAPTASVTIQPTCAVGTGTVVVTNPAEGTGYQYSIGGVTYQASATFIGVSPGNRNVFVRRTFDNTCISLATSVTVNVQPSPPSAPTASVTIQPTCAVGSGTIVVSNPAEYTGFEYSINGTNYQASATFAGVSPGTKNITVRKTLDNTCVSLATNLIVNAVPTAPSAPTPNVTQPNCDSPTGDITVIGPIGNEYEYSLDGVTYQLGVNFLGVAPGNKTLRVRRKNDNTCVSSTTITINPQPPIPVDPDLAVTQPTCTVSKGNIKVNSPLGTGLSYTLTDGSGIETTNTTGIFSSLSADDYTVAVTNSVDCTSNDVSATIDPQVTKPVGAIGVITGTSPVCQSTTGLTYSVADVTNATTYTWTVPVGWTITDGTGTTIITVTAGTTGGTITVTAGNACGTSAASTKTIVVNTKSTAPTSITGTTTICNGSSTVLTASGGTLGTSGTYQWGTGSTLGSNIIVGATSVSYTTPTLSSNTTYWVRRTDPAPCNTITVGAIASVTVNPVLPASVSIVASANPICSGTSVTFTATPVNGGTTPSYQWKLNGVNAGTNSPTYTNAALANGNTVSCVMTSNAPCVSGSPATSNTITISIDPTSVGGSVTGGTPICSGSTSAVLTLAGHTGTITRWESSVNGTDWTTIANTAATYTSGALTATTQFRAVVKSGVCSEVPSTATTVTVTSIPTAVITSGAGTFCGSTTITASGGIGGTIYFQGTTSGGTSTATASSSQVVSSTGKYYFRAQSATGCWGTEGSVNITINAIPTTPTITAGGSTTFCTGGSVTLTSSAGTSYLWSNSATTQNITVSTAGSYTVQVTNASGCQSAASAATVVTVNTYPLAPSTTNIANSCIGSTSTLSASGAVTGDIYKWYSAVTGGTILKTSTSNTDNSYTTPVLSATTIYWVSVLRSGGCESSRTQVSASYPTVSSDSQTRAGTDSWIGHVYKRLDAAAQAPTDVNAFTNYFGTISENEIFDESFIGSTACFSVIASESARSLFPEYFAVKYRMNSTKSGIYLADMGSDDGVRLTVAGVKVFDAWVQRSYTINSKILFQLTGSSNLMFEFYESNGGNRVSFQNLLKVNNNLVLGTSQTVCQGTSLTPITANNALTDAPISSATGFTVSYQWQEATALTGPWIDISGATSIDYLPTVSTAGTYYFKRKLSVSRTNPGMSSATTAIDYSDVATLTIIPYNTLSLSSAVGTDVQTVCVNTAITPITYSTIGATGATVTNLPTGVTGSWSGNVVTISGTPTVAGAELTYTVALTGGCGTINASGTITVSPLVHTNIITQP